MNNCQSRTIHHTGKNRNLLRNMNLLSIKIEVKKQTLVVQYIVLYQICEIFMLDSDSWS